MPEYDESLTKKVMEKLLERKSIPFLELVTLFDLSEGQTQDIVKRLAADGFVRIENPDDVLNEVIIPRQQAFVARR
jgi:DNA-binding Lrp family transcriptional regulator